MMDDAVVPIFPDLKSRSALVSGASRGIGRGIAAILGRQGMKLTLTARSEDKGIEVARILAEGGVECQWVTADLSTPQGAAKAFDAAVARFGELDLLVNNAAILRSKGFLELDEEVYHRSFELNVRMYYQLARLAAAHMAARKSGCIINISSVGGLRAHRNLAGYDASKGAIDALTRSMAVDLAPFGIRVNGIAPGAIRMWKDDLPPDQRKHPGRPVEGIPLRRLGLPEEIGAAVAFLASASAAYITGQTIYVDGGLTTQLTPPGVFI